MKKKKDLRVKKFCRYPNCINYEPKAKDYCCIGCNWDHLDWKRLPKQLRSELPSKSGGERCG